MARRKRTGLSGQKLKRLAQAQKKKLGPEKAAYREFVAKSGKDLEKLSSFLPLEMKQALHEFVARNEINTTRLEL